MLQGKISENIINQEMVIVLLGPQLTEYYIAQ